MKRRLLMYILSFALLFAGVFGTGCTCKSCQYQATKTCNDCVANGLECYGDCTDCVDILRNVIMGESCHDNCIVGRCYGYANFCRDFGNSCVCQSLVDGSSWADEFIDGLHRFGTLTWTCEQKRIEIPNLENYYKVEFTFSVTPDEPIADLCMFFNVAEQGKFLDTDYNSLQGRFLYVAPFVAAGQTVSASITILFSYESIKDYYESDYAVRVTDFYGTPLSK